jgi:hypothetical protein
LFPHLYWLVLVGPSRAVAARGCARASAGAP